MKHTLRATRTIVRILSAIALVALVMLLNSLSFQKTNAQGPCPPSCSGTPNDIPPGYMIIEEDIVVPVDFYRHAESTFIKANFWTNGVVPYEFDGNVTQTNRNAMVKALTDWEAVANVDFRPRNGDPNYVHIQNSNENNSQVGMKGGRQDINIYNWNSEFIMAHELGHTLGFWHEQSNPSRDNYVRINYQNVCQNCCSGGSCNSQFDKRGDAGQYGPYDFDSVMHYGQCSFAINCQGGTNPTITVLTPNQMWQTKIGQRTHLSKKDKLTMSFLYPQPNWRFVDANYSGGTENGKFLTPFKNFADGVNGTPVGGTLWLQPGRYQAVGTYNKQLTIKAPLGGVVLSK